MSIKVFISHNHKDYEFAKEIKSFLENWGFDVFLAHKDIKPSKEWVEVIHQEIKNCDIFIPILTEHFYESEWTDQESGIAFTHNKKIYSIRTCETTPRGFINKWQALYFNNSLKEKQRRKELMKIFDMIELDFTDKIKHALISSLERPYTSTFRDASNKIAMLTRMKPFTKQEINIIMKKSFENDQIYDNRFLKSILRELIEEYKKEIEPDLRDKIVNMLERDRVREMLGGKSLWGGPSLYGDAKQKLEQLEGYGGEGIEEMREELRKEIEKEEKKPSLVRGLRDGL